jgi:hypothetical protein
MGHRGFHDRFVLIVEVVCWGRKTHHGDTENTENTEKRNETVNRRRRGGKKSLRRAVVTGTTSSGFAKKTFFPTHLLCVLCVLCGVPFISLRVICASVVNMSSSESAGVSGV